MAGDIEMSRIRTPSTRWCIVGYLYGTLLVQTKIDSSIAEVGWARKQYWNPDLCG